MSRMLTINSPFLLGFEEFERMVDRVTRAGSEGYPPYNIERIAKTDAEPESCASPWQSPGSCAISSK